MSLRGAPKPIGIGEHGRVGQLGFDCGELVLEGGEAFEHGTRLRGDRDDLRGIDEPLGHPPRHGCTSRSARASSNRAPGSIASRASAANGTTSRSMPTEHTTTTDRPISSTPLATAGPGALRSSDTTGAPRRRGHAHRPETGQRAAGDAATGRSRCGSTRAEPRPPRDASALWSTTDAIANAGGTLP